MKVPRAATAILVSALLWGCSQLSEDAGVSGVAKCAVCHAAPPDDSLHGRHRAGGVEGCDGCHDGNSLDGLYTSAQTHDNGAVDVVFGLKDTLGLVPTYSALTGTCNSVSCHAAPKKCVGCHVAHPPADSLHNSHATNSYGCSGCHRGYGSSSTDGALHFNGAADVVFGLPDTLGLRPVYSKSSGTCASVVCHVAPDRCGGCHAVAPVGTVHDGHKNVPAGCAGCHKGYGATTAEASLHYNGAVDVVFGVERVPGSSAYDTASGTCSGVYCHGGFHQGTNDTVAVGETLTGGCEDCHDIAAIRAGGHRGHVRFANPLLCENCHPGYSLTDTLVNSALHVNGVVDTAGCGTGNCHRTGVPPYTW